MIKTYQNRSADKHQVPQKVFLAGKSRVSDLQLTHVVVEEVGVKEHPEAAACDEEGCHETPYLWRKLPEEKG